MAWHLVQTISGREELAGINLIRQGYQVYSPVIRLDKRTAKGNQLDYVPMFCSYIFVELTPGQDDFTPIRSTRGVIKLVQFGPYPAIVPENIVLALKSREDMNGIHQIDKCDYEKRDPVKVKNGPFTGFSGLFDARDSLGRITVLLDIMMKETRVQMSYRDIEPA